MNRTLIGSLSALSLATLALPALAGELPPFVGNTTAIITADNHYTLYTGTDSALNFIGRNELNAGGTPGTYNWSVPETHTFNTGPKIFIAAWSDDAVAQGVLAQITGPGGTYNSGDALWEVFCTGINLGDGDASPSTAPGFGPRSLAWRRCSWSSAPGCCVTSTSTACPTRWPSSATTASSQASHGPPSGLLPRAWVPG